MCKEGKGEEGGRLVYKQVIKRFHRNQRDVGMAVVSKVRNKLCGHIITTAPCTALHYHLYISRLTCPGVTMLGILMPRLPGHHAPISGLKINISWSPMFHMYTVV